MVRLKLMLKYAFDDLRNQKVRTIMGIFGIMISVGLLAIVLFLSDSISITFVNYLSVDAGNQDMVIDVRHYNGEPVDRSSYFDFANVSHTIETKTDVDIDNYFPRFEVRGNINVSENYDTTNLTNDREYVTISGIDFEKEKAEGFGKFVYPDTTIDMGIQSIPLNHCLIYYGFNEIIKYAANDTLTVDLSITHGNITLKRTVNFTIDKIFDYSLKWPASYQNRHLVVVDIDTFYELFGVDEFSGKCNQLILTFAEKDLYDARNSALSEEVVKGYAAEINLALGLNQYNVDLPKLEILGYSEFMSMGVTIIFVFVSIIGMMISGILINGILKTSVEERIREFGIFRTLGAYKSYNLGIVLLQGFLLCNFGTIAGIVVAFFGTQSVVIPVANSYIGDFLGDEGIIFSFTLSSILIAYLMGIGVGMVVSISPALKVMRLQLIESIHPYRHEDTLYHLQKRATVNYKLIIIGLILVANGGFIFYIIPRLLVSMDMTLMAGTLVAILLIFLIGLTLAGLGLMPIVIRLVILLFRPISKRLHHIIKIFVFRYQRRNSSTTIMFALSFSFVLFASTIIQTLSSSISDMVRLAYGSDMVMETTGWENLYSSTGGGGMMGGMGGGMGGGMSGGMMGFSFGGPSETREYSVDPQKVLTTDFKENLLQIEGVEKVASVLASPDQLTQIYSHGNKIFSASIADYAGISSYSITLLGFDEEYPSTVKTDLMVFQRGNREQAFDQVFHNRTVYKCIINEGTAVAMKVEVGDKVRININRGDEYESYAFIIVGTASAMPGYSFQFGNSQYTAGGGGVIISQETYIEILDLPEPAYIDKFFIKLQENKLSLADDIEGEIDTYYQKIYNYDVVNLEQRMERESDMFETVDILFTLILMATVIICLFGLLSSSYSTILERKKEVGVVRTLGLKGREINRLFIIEALIIMLSSGTVGVIVGWLTGWLLGSTLNLFTNMPYNPVFPWVNFMVLYGISISFVLIGMSIMLRKLRKKKIVDIYRETM